MRSEEQRRKAFTPHPSLLTPRQRFLGGNAEGVTPVPIPNTEVKPLRADGTAWVTAWESRSPPGIFPPKAPPVVQGGLLLDKHTISD